MYCEHLSLIGFRNFARLELDLPIGLTILLGDNAQGKSNLLEALYVTATTKSFRASGDKDLIDWRASENGLPFAKVTARVRRQNRALEVEILIKEDNVAGSGPGNTAATATSKRIRLNGVPKRALDVIGQVNVVMFSPQDIELVLGPPMIRRRYLDITMSQVDSRYCRSLALYNRVLLQRNHLLRLIREGQASTDQLEFWDKEMIEAGAYVVLRRLEMIEAIDGLARDFHRRLTENKESLRVGYRASLDPGEAAPGQRTLADRLGGASSEASRLTAIQRIYAQQVSEAQSREVVYGATLIGPHRDDLLFTVNEREVASLGSRGQQRTVALSMKLAEADFIRGVAGSYPIVLLDDVMSELDRNRRHQVLEMVRPSQQVLITATDEHVFEPEALAQAHVLRVRQGVIEAACAR